MSKIIRRCPNFSQDETDRLLDLVEKYKNIIENKKTGQIFYIEKSATWKKIEEEFNAGGSVQRDAENLKNKYENLKKTSKKKFAEEKKQLYLTGGGRPANVPVNEVDNRIHELLHSQISGFDPLFDCDEAGPSNQQVIVNLDDSIPKNDSPVVVRVDPDSEQICIQKEQDKSGNVPQQRQPTAGVKRTISARQRLTTGDKWQKLAEEKIKLVQQEQEMAKERHELEMMEKNLKVEKLNQEKEINNLIIKKLKLEISKLEN